MDKKITIGITQPEARFENYRSWIKNDDENIGLVTLSAEKQNTDDVKKCNGIVLSGGIDVSPELYNSKRTHYPNISNRGSDRERDDFEMEIFKMAQELNIPVLAICRGMQLVNVSLGGTLVADIEESGRLNHKRNGETDTVHTVSITPGSLLSAVTNAATGEINSAHHQAVDTVSDQLIVNCLSADGVIEGAEWKDPIKKIPLLCVQWHPERMQHKKQNPLSENIRNWFLTAAQK